MYQTPSRNPERRRGFSGGLARQSVLQSQAKGGRYADLGVQNADRS